MTPNLESATNGRPPNWKAFLGPETALIVLQLAFVVFTRMFQQTAYTDDAYIHFRHALNWANGEGLVFNKGEAVLGTTSPVYALTLGSLHMLLPFIEIPNIAKGLNFVLDFGIVLMCILWLRRARVPLLFRHAIVLTLSADPLRIYYSATGMEMTLFIFAMMAVFEFFHRGWWIPGGVLLGCIGWIRPEGSVVWIAVLAALLITKNFRLLVKGMACGVGVALLISLVLYLSYGTIIPQSVTIKSIAPWYIKASGLCPIYFFIRLGDMTPFYIFNRFQAVWGVGWGDRINSCLMASAQITVMLIGVAYFWKQGLKFLALVCSFFVVGYYFFYFFANPQIYRWYYVPYFFSAMLLSGVGWFYLFEMAWQRFSEGQRLRPFVNKLAYGVATACFLVFTLFTESNRTAETKYHTGGLWHGMTMRIKGADLQSREALYVRAAKEVNDWIGEDRSLTMGCVEIGILGYYYNGKILDTFGLVSPEVMDVVDDDVPNPFGDAQGSIRMEMYMRFRPEFIVTAHLWEPFPHPLFLEEYQKVFVPDINLIFYVRRDMLDRIGEDVRTIEVEPEMPELETA